jgi:chemotaxis protein CheC
VELTLDQKDALTELINIGYGRAAGALSELTGYRITLEVPQVRMHEIATLATLLEEMTPNIVASVNQVFTGAISGNALLLLEEHSALVMSQLLTDDRTASGKFDSSAREIITEVGNILLNACLGVFGNLLEVHLNFSVPRLQVDQVRIVLRSVAQEVQEQLRYGLMIQTRFHVKARDVSGYLIIILGITSMDRLLNELKSWETRQLR